MSSETQGNATNTGSEQDGGNNNENNETNNQRRNNNRSQRNRFNEQQNNNSNKFKGKNEKVLTVGTNEEKKPKDQFTQFKDSLEQYITTEFDDPDDFVPYIREIEDPLKPLARSMPTEAKIMEEMEYTSDELSAMTNEEKEELKKSIKTLCDQEMKTFSQRKSQCKKNKTRLWGLIWGNCTPALQNQIKGNEQYKNKLKVNDSVWLLKVVKGLTSGVDEVNNTYLVSVNIIKTFFLTRQGRNESLDSYHNRYESALAAVEMSKVEMFTHPEMEEYERKLDPSATDEVHKTRVKEKLIAMNYLLNADPTRYQQLWDELTNDQLKKQNTYPVTFPEAHTLLCRHRDGGSQRNNRGNDRVRVTFAQTHGDGNQDDLPTNRVIVAGTNGITVANTFCYRCHKYGHIARYCPEANSSGGGVQGMQCQFVNNGLEIIPDNWLLLDSGSTISSLRNDKLIYDIHPIKEPLRVYSNGGHVDYKFGATLRIMPFRVYYNKKGIANILSLSAVASEFRVTMDTDAATSIMVHINDNEVLEFKQCGSGLYYFDTDQDEAKRSVTNVSQEVTNYSLLSTVKSNKSYFTRKEIEGADKARLLQAKLGWPSTADLKRYINNNLIINCPITSDDIARADAIYGPQIPLLKGKTVRQRPEHINNVPRVPLPNDILQHHKTDDLNIDYLFINRKPFLHTKTTKIKFLSIQTCRTKGKKELNKGLDVVLKKYKDRGFSIENINGDNEFEQIRDHVAPINVNIVGRREHVGVIERSIRVVMERVRCTYNGVPYKCIPKIMTQAIIEDTVNWLNAFPHRDGISETISPAGLVQGRPKPDYKNLKIEFGSYAQVYDRTINNQRGRTTGAIALRPSNEQGAYYFMSLSTGKRINGNQWTELPISDYVIDRVEELGKREGAPIMKDGYPIFEWSPGERIYLDEDEEYDDDVSYVPSEQTYNDDNDSIMTEESTEDELGHEPFDLNENDDITDENTNIPEEDMSFNNNDIFSESSEYTLGDDNSEDTIDEDNVENEEISSLDEIGNTEDEINNEQNNQSEETTIENESENDESKERDDDETSESKERTEERKDENEEHTRPRRSKQSTTRKEYTPSFTGKSYVNLLQVASEKLDVNSMLMQTVNMVFAQVSKLEEMKRKVQLPPPGGTGSPQMLEHQAQKEFDEEALAASIFLEMSQMDNMDVFDIIDVSKLTTEDKKRAISVIMFFKLKRCGKLKMRLVGDGRKQRPYFTKEETASPTCTNEGFIMTTVIDAFEKRDVGFFDIPGAYLNAFMKTDKNGKHTIVKITGRTLDIMCEINKKYEHCVVIEKGRKVMYVRMNKALYGCVESALLWYETYAKVLTNMGFSINPYDKCVANKLVNGKQCTLVWYVDDNKLSHEDPKVVSDVISEIEKHFGEVTKTRGKTHDFLGMLITFNNDRTVTIDTRNYLKEAISSFNEDVSVKVSSPATRKLFDVDPESSKLDKQKSELFHSLTAKLLWVAKRGRPDIETTVSFLCQRVQNPTEEDWKKLKRLLQYINQTIDDLRIIGANNLNQLYTFIDGSHAVHTNMRGHTGGTLSMGKGVIHAKASKQKINTKSSTETELVAMSEYVPYSIWMKKFLKHQGYDVKSNVMQDNQSAMLIEKNGRNSCTGNSRHIDIRYYFVKDRVDKGELNIIYCPTMEMLADFYTKPLQGQLYNKFRKVLMGWADIDTLKHNKVIDNTIEERVENVTMETSTPNNGKRTYADVLRQRVQNDG